MLKAIFIDFYGTVVHEDGAVIEIITEEIYKTGTAQNRTKPLRNRNILVEPISIIIPIRLRRPIRNPERTRIPVPRPHPRKIPFSVRCKITQRADVRTLGATAHFRRIKTLF